MRFVLGVLEVGHAINARKGGGVAAVAVCIELFLRQDVSTGLRWNQQKVSLFSTKRKEARGIDYRETDLAGERHHFVDCQGGV